MDLADMGKPEEECEEKGVSCEDKSINIDISLIMGKMGGKPPSGFGKDEDDEEEDSPKCLEDMLQCDDDDGTDWKSIAKQLLQAVSMMDTHTDGVNSGTEDPEGALKAIDNETSRVLWGKQEEDNPRSSYQNANYGKTTANGLVMTNPAELCNEDVYEDDDKDKPKEEEKPKMAFSPKPEAQPKAPSSPQDAKQDIDDDDHDDPMDDKDDDHDDDFDHSKGFPPKASDKPKGFKKAAEGIIKRGEKKRQESNKFYDDDDLYDDDDPDDDKFDNRKMR